MKNENKGDLKKQLILKAALTLFAKDGIHSVSFQKIADLAGLKQTTVLYHFRSKTELLAATIKSTLTTSSQIIDKLSSPSDNAYDRLLIHFKGNLQWVSEFPNEASIFSFIYYSAGTDKKMAQLYREIINQLRPTYQTYLYAGIREKIFNIKTDQVEMVAEVIHELLMGSIINYFILKDSSKSKIIKKWELSIKNLLSIN